jgi:hypothetical protein
MNVSPMPGMAPLSDTPTAEAEAPARAETKRPGARPQAQSTAKSNHGTFVPTLLCAMALCGWFGFQTLQSFDDRGALLAAHASQQQTVDNAGKLRASLDALAADTQRMAETGNVNARALVEELRRRGVTINSSAAPATLPAKK